MKKWLLISALVLCPIVFVSQGFAQASTAVTYEYAKIEYPGAGLTLVNGINNRDVVVGSFFDSSDNEYGFVYHDRKYTVVNFPGATATEVLGINDSDDIVGTYQLPGPLAFHGFLRRKDVFYTIDDPQASFGTMAFGINDNKEIVGSYDNAHGFVYKNGTYETLDAPQLQGEPSNTQLNGIDNLGWIAGQVFTGEIWRGFWIRGKDLDFVEPAGNNDSQVTGINGRGDVVGCHDAQAGFVSFSVERNEGREAAERFPVEVRLASCASAINYARVVVGSYFSVSRPYGFLAVPELTLKVSSPRNHSSYSNPVPLSATAFGIHPIAEIKIWVDSKEAFHVKGNTLNTRAVLPIGANERFVVQAIDSSGVTTKVVETISVY
jgi:uncharacterized membrane protein